MKKSAEGAIVAALELAASKRPELLDFQLETFLNSHVRFAVLELAAALDVPQERLAPTLYKACLDLDELEKLRRSWSDPAQVLESPNVAALCKLCAARIGRVAGVARRRRLQGLCLKLERAWDLARRRAWIEAFIGPPLSREGRQRADG